MPGGCYACTACLGTEREFRVPADEIGVELMRAHLEDVHGVIPVLGTVSA